MDSSTIIQSAHSQEVLYDSILIVNALPIAQLLHVLRRKQIKMLRFQISE